MKKLFGIVLSFILAIVAGAAIADNSIPQVSSKATTSNAEASLLSGDSESENDDEDKDYQSQVLSDPVISDVARTKELTGNGGNTAVIIQQGKANNSTIIQSGDDNYASQTQDGEFNDIKLNQSGNHNRSEEKQTCKYNHKVIIQNGQKKETTTITIEQVEEKLPEDEKP